MATPDFGPVYAETNWDAIIKEPFNALTAALFVALAVVWLVRLHPARQQHRFVYWGMWGLLIGGLGGSVYHAFRAHWAFLALDALPIGILGVATAIYAIRRLTRDWLWILAPIFAVATLRAAIGYLLPGTFAINSGYALLGLAMITPLVLLAIRAKRGLWDRLVPGAGLFALALACRAGDLYASRYLSIGTHGLWHLFAAGAVWLLILFLVETRDVPIEASASMKAEPVPARPIHSRGSRPPTTVGKSSETVG